MAVGGFKFAKMTAQYDSATMTIRQWGLKVHEARCLAFLDASNKGDSGWESISDTDPRFSGFTLDEREQEAEDGNYYTFIVAELITAADDPTGVYPAYMSVFKAPENDLGHTPEYMIVTAFGFKGEANATINVGIALKRGLNIETNRDNILSGNSCMHAFAANGFNNFDLKSDILNPGEFKIAPMVPYRSQSMNRNSVTNNNYSLIATPNPETLTYYFGYAIKNDIIECFYKSSAVSNGLGWDFMVLGRIFGDDCVGSDWPYGYASKSTVLTTRSDKQNIETSDTTYTGVQNYGNSSKAILTLNSSGSVFPSHSDLFYSDSITNSASIYASVLEPCYMPAISKSQVPDELPYCAYVMTFIPHINTTSAINGNGLDETNTLTKGMISTDILRCVSAYACRIGGATYSNGQFIALYCGQSFTGMLVGWDPSNESLV